MTISRCMRRPRRRRRARNNTNTEARRHGDERSCQTTQSRAGLRPALVERKRSVKQTPLGLPGCLLCRSLSLHTAQSAARLLDETGCRIALVTKTSFVSVLSVSSPFDEAQGAPSVVEGRFESSPCPPSPPTHPSHTLPISM